MSHATQRATLAAVRSTLLDRVGPHGRTERVPVEEADGRLLAESVTAPRDVPHYRRAAMDGYALRAADTEGATPEDPAVLLVGESVAPGRAVRVHTGSQVPADADAVARLERTRSVERDGETALEVTEPIPEGKDVAPAGEDVPEGQLLYELGDRLDPPGVGLLLSAGVETVAVADPTSVAVVPTGEELVASDPVPGEVVETNGRMVARYVSRWGGVPEVFDPVGDDVGALRAALVEASDADLVVTTGGSSVGERDLVPDVLSEVGTVLTDGMATKPAHPTTTGVVDATPVVALAGYPVAAVVGAVQLVRPAVYESMGALAPEIPSTRATLEEEIDGERGVRRFERVYHTGDRARPVPNSGAGALSSAALSSGWVVLEEAETRLPAGETVAVQRWDP